MKIKVDIPSGEDISTAAVNAVAAGFTHILFNGRLYLLKVQIDQLSPGSTTTLTRSLKLSLPFNGMATQEWNCFMTKPRLIIPVGIPRSGKSTFFRERWPRPIPIVSPDEIRKYFGCFPFDPKREDEVWNTARCMVHTLFAAGAQEVVLDATNVSRGRRNHWRALDVWRRSFYQFNTPTEVCIDRALKNAQDYLLPVIERMARNFEPVTSEEMDLGDDWTDATNL